MESAGTQGTLTCIGLTYRIAAHISYAKEGVDSGQAALDTCGGARMSVGYMVYHYCAFHHFTKKNDQENSQSNQIK